jgi:hypothetical protein
MIPSYTDALERLKKSLRVKSHKEVGELVAIRRGGMWQYFRFEGGVCDLADALNDAISQKDIANDYAQNPSGYGRCIFNHDHAAEENLCVYQQ